ncbi:hypothetical protein ACJIZ3_003595 [Penstemon smallii]|uniref:Uncharacterized protein n=1 Tax=Penstemon smallii TaxID=265156 RepID=A0ABD3UAY9_9LAMI
MFTSLSPSKNTTENTNSPPSFSMTSASSIRSNTTILAVSKTNSDFSSIVLNSSLSLHVYCVCPRRFTT